jgi:hypothetical protein
MEMARRQLKKLAAFGVEDKKQTPASLGCVALKASRGGEIWVSVHDKMNKKLFLKTQDHVRKRDTQEGERDRKSEKERE